MASILHTGTMPLTEELILESRRLRRQLSFLRQELEIERLRNVELRLGRGARGTTVTRNPLPPTASTHWSGRNAISRTQSFSLSVV